jgi:predicted alpha/beta hydrolase family esterase
MKKAIFVHGYTSSPTRKKYQLIGQELERLGIEYAIPAFPGERHPDHKQWLSIIDQEVTTSKHPVILVGHSLGTRAVLLYLDQFDRHIAAAVLIAAFNNKVTDREEGYANFFEYPVDVQRVKSRADTFVVAHSIDDDAIPYHEGEEISKELGARFIPYQGMEHFSGEERAEENAKEFLNIITSVL